MLILTRRRGESIIIGDDIEIHVLDLGGDIVHIGIEAPREIPVHRREIYEAIQEENIAAARAAAEMARQLKGMDLSLLPLEHRGSRGEGDKDEGKDDGEG